MLQCLVLRRLAVNCHVARRPAPTRRVFTSKMSRTLSRYFDNPYLKDADSSPTAAKLERELKSVKEDLQKTIERIVIEEPAETANPEGGLYVGSAGIAYAFLYVSQLQWSSDADTAAATTKEYLSLAQNYLEPSLSDLEERGSRVDYGFLLGDGGVMAVAAVLADKAGNQARSNAFAKRYAGMAEFCKPETFLPSGSDEFFVGRAGYLYGALWLNKQLGRIVVPMETMHELARVIVESGKNYSRRHKSPCPLMYAYYDTEYLGAAHGLASILQVLIQVGDCNKLFNTMSMPLSKVQRIFLIVSCLFGFEFSKDIPGKNFGLTFIPNQLNLFRNLYPHQSESIRKKFSISFDIIRLIINPSQTESIRDF